MLLPFLGGGSGVWLTCMFFFQTVLLLGYLYSHLLLRTRHSSVLHSLILILSVAFLPILDPRKMTWTPDDPVISVLTYLFSAIGLPFLALSSTAPLLQRWYASISKKDPYHLYSISNLGSISALLAFPFLLERLLTIGIQSTAWSLLYGFFGILVVICGFLARNEPVELSQRIAGVSVRTKLHWVFLAFLPSSLLLGVTNHLTTDLAAVPLLWIIPLILYLLSFVITFSKSWNGHAAMARIQPILAIPLVIWMSAGAQAQVLTWIPYGFHLLNFFVIAIVFNGQLSRSKPDKSSLTEFYLMLAIGGWLGSVLNVFAAPLLFDRIIEYPLVFLLGCIFLPAKDARRLSKWDLGIPVLIGAAYLCADAAITLFTLSGPEHMFLVCGISALLCLPFMHRPIRFGLAIAVILAASSMQTDFGKDHIHHERTFYGVHRIQNLSVAGRNYHFLSHGSTIHGVQRRGSNFDTEPLSYYHVHGPVGHIFGTLSEWDTTSPIAAVGLGAGAVASYVEPGRKIVFFEIDPAVERIARNPEYFTYLSEARGNLSIVLGDARLSLENDSEKYSLLILDAFSSDAIPVHLLTEEAMATYLDHTTESGILAFHISNRHLDLVPVISRLTKNAGLFCYYIDYHSPPPDPGYFASKWMVAARDTESLIPIIYDSRWVECRPEWEGSLWTDDFSNILETLQL